MEMTDTDNGDNVRLVAVIVAAQNLVEVGGDFMRRPGASTATTVAAIAGALNSAETALLFVQRECPTLFRTERG